MKTVFKKMLSLMLVAMLLVSAVPFQASATLIEPLGPTKDTTEATDATDSTESKIEEQDSSNDTLSITVMVMDKNTDSTLETLGPVEIMASDYEEMGSTYDDAIFLLEELDSKYADISKKDFVSMAKFTNQVIIMIKSVTNDDGESVQPPVEGNAEKYTLNVNVGGSYPIEVYEGQLYVDVLKGRQPERPGQKFVGWKSEKLGRVIKGGDVITGDDTVTALFSDPIQYNLTLDENRKGEEVVNRGKLVTYGAPIGDLYTPERKGYVFVGWKLNGKYITEDTIWELQGDGTAYAQWKLESDEEDEPMNGGNHVADGEVYLEIYKNGNTKELVKRVKVTKYVENNKISLDDAKSVAKKYVSPKSGYKLSFDGLFDEESWWWYCKDEETNGEKSVIVNQDGDDYVYIMVNNVKSSSNADTSNPKTGDSIFMAVTIMALSGTALAAAYIFNKKRAI